MLSFTLSPVCFSSLSDDGLSYVTHDDLPVYGYIL